jgi:hypothetical protein
MTSMHLCTEDDLSPAQQPRHRAETGFPPEQSGWLTTVLRLAGRLDQQALRRLAEALSALAVSSDMVIVDLAAVDAGNPHAIAKSLRAPALRFELAGRCLLLVGASTELTAELDRINVPIVTLAASALPFSAA